MSCKLDVISVDWWCLLRKWDLSWWLVDGITASERESHGGSLAIARDPGGFQGAALSLTSHIVPIPRSHYFCLWACIQAQSFVFGCLFETLWTVAYQALLFMGFSRQEDWSGLPCLSPGDLPNSRIKPMSPVSSGLQANSLPTKPPGKSLLTCSPSPRPIVPFVQTLSV